MIHKLVFAAFLAYFPCQAQVIVLSVPENMAVPMSVLANAKSMGRHQIVSCNDGPNLVTVSRERILIALSSTAGAPSYLTPESALLVLTADVRRSTANRIVTVLRYAGAGASIGLALASRSNVGWATGIGIGTGIMPDVINVVQGAVPSAVPLISTVKWPITLSPKGLAGDCATDYWFAGKMRSPRPITAIIQP
jgi:hypothetical protein